MDVDKALPSSKTPLKDGVGGLPPPTYGDTLPLETPTTKGGYLAFVRTLTIEPALFLFSFGYIMSMSCLTSMMMDKGCRYTFEFPEAVCRNLSGHPDQKALVEVLANNYALYANLLGLVAAFVMVFVAPWSDRHGRKLPLVLAALGHVVTTLCTMLCAFYFSSPLYWLVLAKLPAELFGGFIAIMSGVFTHASEVSTQDRRTQKYATVEVSLGLGMSLGGLAGGSILRYYGYLYVYLCSCAIQCFCVAWIVACVQETRGLDDVSTCREKLRDFFRLEHLTQGWRATLRPRENHGRTLILMLFLSTCFLILTYESFGSIGFTYVHHLYNWDPMAYNQVNTVFMLTSMALLLVAVPVLARVCNVTDNILGLLGTASACGKFALIAFAHAGVYVFYAGNAFGSLANISPLALRSRISKILGKDELGTVFSFLATCESVVPMAGTVLLTKVFNATIDITPSVTYLLTAVLLIFPFATFTFAHYLTKRQQSNPSIQ